MRGLSVAFRMRLDKLDQRVIESRQQTWKLRLRVLYATFRRMGLSPAGPPYDRFQKQFYEFRHRLYNEYLGRI